MTTRRRYRRAHDRLDRDLDVAPASFERVPPGSSVSPADLPRGGLVHPTRRIDSIRDTVDVT